MTYTLRLKQPKPPAIENQGNGSLAKGFGQILYEPIVFSRLPRLLQNGPPPAREGGRAASMAPIPSVGGRRP